MKQVLGYVSDWSVAPGDSVDVMVSTYGAEAYQADLVRVICGDARPDGPGFRVEEIPSSFAGSYRGRTQPINAGSYGIVRPSRQWDLSEGFAVQAMIWPTTPRKGKQGIVTKWCPRNRGGFALFVDEIGCLGLYLGDGMGRVIVVNTQRPLVERVWSAVGFSVDPATDIVRLYNSPNTIWATAEVVSEELSVPFTTIDPLVPLLFAAFWDDDGDKPANFFNGKISWPLIAGRAYTLGDIKEHGKQFAPPVISPATLAAWDFSMCLQSDQIIDCTANGFHGTVVNLPSRGVTGSNWGGQHYSWKFAHHEYAAIHFHDDDLYDAGWNPDFAFEVPLLKSGVYAIRLRTAEDTFHIPLFMRSGGAPSAKLAFLASTATYLAYANYQWTLQEPLAEMKNHALLALEAGDVFLQEHPEFGLSTYDRHSDGSGSRYASRLRPVLNMDIGGPLWSFNADTHILDWLEWVGQPYDVITDDDLHEHGADLLAKYRVIITGAHPEYWTTPMWGGMKAFLGDGGRLLYTGGNGFYWRCAYDDRRPGAIEVRRAETGARYWAEEPGEFYFQFTGEYGGLWRRIGEPPQGMVGVGTVATGFDRSSYYRRRPGSHDPRAKFIFEGIADDVLIGNFGALGGGAAGVELDATNARLGTPPHALILAASERHSPGMFLVPEETEFHHEAMDGAQNEAVRAELVFFETPGGGAVFSTGSIAWAASLACNGYDNNVSRVTANVIRRFVSEVPFLPPDGPLPGARVAFPVSTMARDKETANKEI